MADNYVRAKSTIFGGWHDSELRDWLVSHGLAKSDSQAKRDDMIKLIGDKWVHSLVVMRDGPLTWGTAAQVH